MTDGNDRELFRGFIGTVRRLNVDRVHLQKNKKPLPVPRKRFIGFDVSDMDAEFPELAELSVADTLNFVGPGVQKNVLRKLKRGFFGRRVPQNSTYRRPCSASGCPGLTFVAELAARSM